jgi:CHAT domain-containing protein/tetratricopeptide (TPR) repeat protein
MQLIYFIGILFLLCMPLQSAMGQSTDQRAVQAKVLIDKGNACLDNAPKRALQYYRQALPLRIAAFGALSGPTANVYENIGICYQRLKNAKAALSHYKKSLSIHELLRPNSAFTDSTRLNLAFFYYNQLEYDSAAVLYRSINYRSGEPIDLFLAARRGEGLCYFNRGYFEGAMAQFRTGIDAADMQTHQDATLTGELWKYKGHCLNNLGFRDDALRAYKQALLYGSPTEKSDLWRTIGELYTTNGFWGDAKAAFDSSALYGNGIIDNLAYSMARMYNLSDNRFPAIQLYQEALASFETNGSQEFQVRAMLGLASLHMRHNEVPKAISWFEKAKQKAIQQGYGNRLLFQAKFGLALAYTKIGHTSNVRRLLETLVPLVERDTTRLPYESILLYNALARWHRNQAVKSRQVSDWKQVLAWADRASKVLARQSAIAPTDWDAISVEDDFSSDQVWAVEAYMALGRFREAFVAAEQIRWLAAQRVAQRHAPQNGKKTYTSPDEHLIETIQRQLTTEQSLLEFTVLPDTLVLFVVQQQQFKVLRTPVSSDDLYTKTAIFFDLCSTSPFSEDLFDRALDALPRRYSELGHELYRLLLGHAADSSLLTPNLLIVPSGSIAYVPFAALLTQTQQPSRRYANYPFLAKKHHTTCLQSAVQWLELHQYTPTATKDKLLAFAPYFEHWKGILKPLQNNVNEIKSLKSVFSGQMHTGQTATRSRFCIEAGQYRWLHLATHGVANGDAPDASYVAFSVAPSGHIDTAALYTADIFNLSLQAEMVVLSACETAMGKNHAGEGLLSLGRAFQYAGAQTVVASLWKVDDVQTPDLMLRFYEALQEKNLKTTALNIAQNHYLNRISQPEKPSFWQFWKKVESPNAALAHPFFWAGFMVMGKE